MSNHPRLSAICPWRRALATTVLAAALLLGLGACASPQRPILTEAQLETRHKEEIAADADSFRAGISDLVDRIAREYDDHNAGRCPDPPMINILAISGGGDYGAFGAGFLVGWGAVSDHAMHRPDFDAVTGVSTGGLIAPFAYIGAEESYEQIETFYRNPKSDWVQSRGLLFFLPHFASFMTIPGLERDVRAAVDDRFIAHIAEQRRRGKLLAISATNLDLAAQRVWEVGAEAVRVEATGDKVRISRMMLASAAIPAVFPPVEIDGFLFADGGVTANVFLRLDPTQPNSFFRIWRERYPDRPYPRTRYWIIVNNWLAAPPKTIQPRWPNVVSPSLSTSIRSATVAEIRWLTAEVQFVNAAYHTDIEVRVVAIPEDWRPPVEGDFKKETMGSLADVGRRLGADPGSWRVLAPRADDKTLPPLEGVRP